MSSSAPGESRSFLGKYEIVKHIASGGMGAVYRAVDTKDGREVALKVLAPELAAREVMRERLRREAVNGAKLTHENIVALYEYDEFQGTCFLAMEYVHGVDLSDYIIRNGPLTPEQARRVVSQMADALAHIHELGMVHRDIKPSNILLTKKDDRTIAKLADLGLSRETRDEDFRLTREGHTVGTVDYLAPEQARNSRLADIRSDIYSLGCTMYHMLTGAPPFSDGSLPERLLKHAEMEPPDLRTHNKHIPADLAAICRRMLAKKPDDRYQTPAELLRDLSGQRPDGPMQKASEENAAAADAEATDLDDKDKQATPKTARQRAASGELEVAKKAIAAGDHRYGIRLLLEYCRREPSSIDCRQTLREAVEGADGAWWGWLGAAYYRLRLRMAKMFRKPRMALYYGEKVLLHHPGDLNAQLLMAEAAVRCRYLPLGQWILEQAKKSHGPNVMIHRALAFLGEKRGDVKQAISYWEMVQRANPENPEARQHLKNLEARETLDRGRFDERLDMPSAPVE